MLRQHFDRYLLNKINALNFRNEFLYIIIPCSQGSPGLLAFGEEYKTKSFMDSLIFNTIFTFILFHLQRHINLLPLFGELYFCEGFHDYLLAVINSSGLILINKSSSCGLPQLHSICLDIMNNTGHVVFEVSRSLTSRSTPY